MLLWAGHPPLPRNRAAGVPPAFCRIVRARPSDKRRRRMPLTDFAGLESSSMIRRLRPDASLDPVPRKRLAGAESGVPDVLRMRKFRAPTHGDISGYLRNIELQPGGMIPKTWAFGRLLSLSKALTVRQSYCAVGPSPINAPTGDMSDKVSGHDREDFWPRVRKESYKCKKSSRSNKSSRSWKVACPIWRSMRHSRGGRPARMRPLP
jgi:hypothetical protein